MSTPADHAAAASPLYLASSSPRRRQLLTDAGIAFTLFVVPVDEERLSEEYRGPMERLGEFLARHKAQAAQMALRADGREGLVLAADTTVLLDGTSLAKPRDAAEAEWMLRQLRGRTHTVATGVALAGPKPDAVLSATSATQVLMRDYGDAEIAAFVDTGDPFDKAGGYSVQHPDFQPVASIAGCHLGVVGLPLCIVARLLGRGPLPPIAADADACMWSPRCQPPLPAGL